MQYSIEDITAKFKRMKKDGSTDNNALEVIADLNGCDKETIYLILTQNNIQCRKPRLSRKEIKADEKKRESARKTAEKKKIEITAKQNEAIGFIHRAINRYMDDLIQEVEQHTNRVEEINKELQLSDSYYELMAKLINK